MSIEIKNLTKYYGTQKALDNVSFSVGSGTVVGFLGPNGAGKSTLMKIVTGLLSPTSGTVLVEGLDVAENINQIKKIIGYLPENNPLYLDMYVKEYLQYTANIYHLSNTDKVVGEVIERTGLAPECRKKIGALSKGYKQRVGLAQAIIHNPQVLILDEPTTGLDPNQIVEIRNLILELGREKTILLSTHIMQEVQAICHQMAILDHGVLVANGSAEQIGISTRNNRRQVEVEFNLPVDEKMLLQIANIVAVEKTGASTYVLESDSEADVRQDVFNFAVQHNLAVLAMQVKQKSMEEVFQELTKNKH
ncbi:MAG: gliding motility-associated ABC transporter ATP-binding subunit GldA [Salinivirgaceae bacterium]|nr:gliding motility-associated ABC transporter ATP-binding subunit GldA [Salinivirgaceae bacterium]MBR5643629.1 gliding motility-associated ABC transporter ATP-binding subunit GldA [Salinivirgaceae bacterium]